MPGPAITATLAFTSPPWLLWVLLSLALLVAPAIAVSAYRRTEPRVTGTRRATLVALRLLALLTLVAMLAEPVLFRSRTAEVHPSVLLLVDNSASMGIATADGGTRLDAALRAREDAARTLREFHDRAPIWFGEGARRLEHSATAADGARVGELAEGTDLRALLVSATQRHLDDELAAVVLFSDGRSTGSGAGASLDGLNVPVWAVAAGDSAGPADLGLTRVRYPARVPRGDRLALEGEVLVRSPEAGSTRLRLGGAAGAVDSLEVQWPAGTSRHRFEFEVATDSVGYARYHLDLAPLAGENVTRNNRQEVGIRIEKDRLRVLHVASRPGWDAHFLRNAVSQDARIQWDVLYRTPGGLRIAGKDSVLTWPLPPAEVETVDLFVASHAEDLALLGAEESGVLDALRRGGALWIVAGDPADAPTWPASIRAVAPVVPGRRARWIYGELRAALPAEARAHPVWASGDGPAAIAEALGKVPPLQSRIAPVGLAADADVLLRVRGSGQESPLLAVRSEGAGRVAVWNGAPLWSWSFWRLGDEGSQEFFRQLVTSLVVWAAEGGDRQRLRLQVPRPVVARGEVVDLRALALDPQLRPDLRHDVWLEWARSGDDSTVVGRSRMAPDPATEGARIAELPALPAGDYRLRATMEENSTTVSSAWSPLTVDPFSVEFLDPRVDRIRLGALARATGGRSLGPDGFEDWARELDLTRRERVLTGRIDLSARWWMLLPLLAFLSAEWALRKQSGLI